MQTVWCLHGNLQRPTVWNGLGQPLKLSHRALQIQLIDLWETLEHDCWIWAHQFCSNVQRLSPAGPHYLLGYSLGGRLAWYALLTNPELWAGAVIVSAGTGLANGPQKEQCLKRDRIWANRFLTEPWDELLAEWDDLPVFCRRPCTIPRLEADFDQRKIAHAFEAYSKGHMDDLTEQLRFLSVPITYVTGSDDRRYCQLGQALQGQCPNLTHVEVTDAGHRVPWEQPDIFLSILKNTLDHCS